MQDALQHTWDVNEDLQTKLEATERSSAEYSSKLSLKLYYAAQVMNITGLLQLPVVQCRYVVHCTASTTELQHKAIVIRCCVALIVSNA